MASDAVRDPESWPAAFTQRLDAGDVDGILSLYESEAKMLAPPEGTVTAGHAAIAAVMAGLSKSQARLQSHVVSCVTVADIAILYTDFRGSLTEPSGARREMQQRAIEVLRRQSDGSWKLVFGDPMGRAAWHS